MRLPRPRETANYEYKSKQRRTKRERKRNCRRLLQATIWITSSPVELTARDTETCVLSSSKFRVNITKFRTSCGKLSSWQISRSCPLISRSVCCKLLHKQQATCSTESRYNIVEVAPTPSTFPTATPTPSIAPGYSAMFSVLFLLYHHHSTGVWALFASRLLQSSLACVTTESADEVDDGDGDGDGDRLCWMNGCGNFLHLHSINFYFSPSASLSRFFVAFSFLLLLTR